VNHAGRIPSLRKYQFGPLLSADSLEGRLKRPYVNVETQVIVFSAFEGAVSMSQRLAHNTEVLATIGTAEFDYLGVLREECIGESGAVRADDNAGLREKLDLIGESKCGRLDYPKPAGSDTSMNLLTITDGPPTVAVNV